MTLPTGPLVTDEMLETLRGYAYQGLQTPVVIKRRTVSDNAYGGSKETWAVVASTYGWMRQMNDPVIANNSGLASTVGIFRLELPVGTDVLVADKVVVEGAEYVVENTSVEDTVQIFLEAYVRRVS